MFLPQDISLHTLIALTPDGFSAALSLCREEDSHIQVLDTLECEVEHAVRRYCIEALLHGHICSLWIRVATQLSLLTDGR